MDEFRESYGKIKINVHFYQKVALFIFIFEFFKKTLEEIRNELVKQYMFNESLEDEQEYEKIVIPKIRKN